MTAATASAAESPASRRSNTRAAKVGSVTFWVATAPTPARACGHRDPTQMDDVVMATPNMPVRAQWPVIEKVMRGT
jgi:hypothetical protein